LWITFAGSNAADISHKLYVCYIRDFAQQRGDLCVFVCAVQHAIQKKEDNGFYRLSTDEIMFI
jgi:hypothetical protein